MRRLKVTWRPEAEADLIQIYRWILDVSRNRTIARGYVQRIRDRAERIGNVPLGGRPRDDLEPGLRIVPFEKAAVIAYTVEKDRVRITNVFYGGRDYEALYRGAEPEESSDP